LELRGLVRRRLERYTILLAVLTEYHPLLKSGEMKDEVLDEDDLDYEHMSSCGNKSALSNKRKSKSAHVLTWNNECFLLFLISWE
jgi:hypothetical protein